MNRSDILGLIAAFSFAIGLFVALWLFLANYWATLPAWLAVTLCILVAAAAIGSPIYSLARISNRLVLRQRAVGRRPGERRSGKLP